MLLSKEGKPPYTFYEGAHTEPAPVDLFSGKAGDCFITLIHCTAILFILTFHHKLHGKFVFYCVWGKRDDKLTKIPNGYGW